MLTGFSDSEPGHRKLAFPRNAEPHPTRGQDFQARAGTEQVDDQRGGRDHLFDIVEEEQEVPVPEPPYEEVQNRVSTGCPEPEGPRDGGTYQTGVADRVQRNEL